MNQKLTFLLIAATLLTCSLTVNANVVLAKPFSDNMVLQRNCDAAVWGTADPEESVSVRFRAATATVTAEKDGQWRLAVKTGEAGGPFELTVTGANTLVVKNILVGEVWIGSGQSNMNMALLDGRGGVLNWEKEVAQADLPAVRLLQMPNGRDRHEPKFEGIWTTCTPETARHFSAILYFFARRLSAELHVPVGVINASVGGSAITPWIPGGDLHKRCIAPLVPFSVRGFLWYQGETDVNMTSAVYGGKMRQVIEGWRREWGHELPFYYVQIAPFMLPEHDAQAAIWEAMTRTLALPATGMVSTFDVGDLVNIHPKDKQTVAARLANLALRETYGQQGLAARSPRFHALTREGHALRVSFDDADGGLLTSDATDPDWVQIAGTDKVFRWAHCRIDGATLLVSHPDIPEPVAVRYGWDGLAEPNLLGKLSHLPVLPFRSDDWESGNSAKPPVIDLPTIQAADAEAAVKALEALPATYLEPGGRRLAAIRLAKAGNDLAVLAEVTDCRAGTPAAKDIALEIFGSKTDNPTVRQLVLMPCTGHVLAYEMSKQQPTPPVIRQLLIPQAGGCRVALLIPLAFFGLTDTDTALRFELAATLTPNAAHRPTYHALFGSVGAFRDNTRFATLKLGK